MNYDKSFRGEHYDIGTGSNISLNEIKNIIQEYHPEVDFDYVPPREGDVLFTKADVEKIKKIGWQPQVSIEEGIRRCFKKE